MIVGEVCDRCGCVVATPYELEHERFHVMNGLHSHDCGKATGQNPWHCSCGVDQARLDHGMKET